MAVAEKRVERRVIEDVTVVLKLSEDEARTLMAVLSRVGGMRSSSPRGHASNMLDALRQAGYRHPEHTAQLEWRGATYVRGDGDPADPGNLIEGKLNFRDYPEGA
jgi:hypothetical protein